MAKQGTKQVSRKANFAKKVVGLTPIDPEDVWTQMEVYNKISEALGQTDALAAVTQSPKRNGNLKVLFKNAADAKNHDSWFKAVEDKYKILDISQWHRVVVHGVPAAYSMEAVKEELELRNKIVNVGDPYPLIKNMPSTKAHQSVVITVKTDAELTRLLTRGVTLFAELKETAAWLRRPVAKKSSPLSPAMIASRAESTAKKTSEEAHAAEPESTSEGSGQSTATSEPVSTPQGSEQETAASEPEPASKAPSSTSEPQL